MPTQRFSVLKTDCTWDHAPSRLQSSRQKRKRERHLSLSFLQERSALVLYWQTRGVGKEWDDEVEKVWDWSRPAEVLESWRIVAAEHQIPQGNRYLQGYEDDLDVLVRTLKESDKNDKDRPHLCRAIWRRKRARRRHMDRQKKLECCEEGRAPPGKPKSKHVNWERVFGNEEVPKAISEFYSAIF